MNQEILADDLVSQYLDSLQRVISRLPHEDIWRVIRIILAAWRENRQIFILGNGGSAASASHFAVDLAKNIAVPGKGRFRAIALTDNVPYLTALANDEGYENVFSEQLIPLLRTGDVVIGISGSGNSPNVLKAMQIARAAQATTIGLTGFQGGKLKDLVDYCIIVPSDEMKQIEDVHLILEHCICHALKALILASE